MPRPKICLNSPAYRMIVAGRLNLKSKEKTEDRRAMFLMFLWHGSLMRWWTWCSASFPPKNKECFSGLPGLEVSDAANSGGKFWSKYPETTLRRSFRLRDWASLAAFNLLLISRLGNYNVFWLDWRRSRLREIITREAHSEWKYKVEGSSTE